MKKILLSFLMFLPLFVYAYDVQIDGIYYNLDLSSEIKTATVTSGTNKYSDGIVIPGSITYENVTYSVTSIGSSAFSDCRDLTSVTIPNSVTSIGTYAFSSCENMTSVTISEGVTSIGYHAFAWCNKLSKVILPSTITSIGEGAFVTHYQDFHIISHITKPFAISDNVFGRYNYNNHTTDPSTVTLCVPIGTKAKYKALSGWNKFAKIEEGELLDVTVDGLHYEYFTGSKTATVIRDDSYLNLTSIEISSTIMVDGVQYDVTAIGKYAFQGCSNLTSITIPNSVTTIGEGAFQNCYGLTSVTIPNSVTTIGEGAFQNCYGLTSVTIPNSVTTIDDYAFDDCNGLVSITIPNSVTSIGGSAFQSCSNLTSITIPNSVTTIGGGAFGNCHALTSITIPNSVTSIDEYTFYGCRSLRSVTIPEGVTSIGRGAFRQCSHLSKVELPSTLTSIDEYAFVSTPSYNNIRYVISHITDPFAISDMVFGIEDDSEEPTIPLSATLFVPVGTKSKYEALSGWNKIGKIEEGDFFETTIDGLRYVCKTGPKTATLIRDNSYTNLTSVEIPVSITVDEEQYEVTEIGIGAFSRCGSLTSITIPNSVTFIADSAFYNCWQLPSLMIPQNVTYIGDNAFAYCGDLTSFVVEDGNPVYDSRNNCNALIETATNTLIVGCKNTEIPSSVVSIGDRAFESCQLQTVIIPEGVRTIGENAFRDCDNLSKVIIPSTITSIGIGAFVSYSSYSSPNIISHITEPFAISDVVFGISNVIPPSTTDPSPAILYVPVGTKSKYEALSGWNKFAKIEEGDLLETTINSLRYEYKTGSKTATVIHDDSYEELESVEIPAMITVDGIDYAVTSIGRNAFRYCYSLTDIVISEGIQTIGEQAFYNCNLYKIELPSTISSIGNSAFMGNNCIDVIISRISDPFPIEENVFSHYSASLYVMVGSKSRYETIHSWVKFTEIVEIEGEMKEDFVGDLRYRYFTGSQTAIVIRDERYKQLESVEIPAKIIVDNKEYAVTGIGKTAFYYCNNITDIVIPEGIQTIGERAFDFCYHLAEVTSRIKEPFVIPEDAFYHIPVTATLYVPEGTMSNYKATLGWNEINRIEEKRPIEVTIDGFDYAIYGSSKTAAIQHVEIMFSLQEIPSKITYEGIVYTVTEIGNDAFVDYYSGNHRRSLYFSKLPEDIEVIGDRAFRNTDMVYTIFSLPKKLKKIGNNTFDNCGGLHYIDFPEGIKYIGNYAFQGCTDLQMIELPATLSYVGNRAFYNCPQLSYVISHIDTPFIIDQGVFRTWDPTSGDIPSYATLYVPDGTKTKYESIAGWTQFADIVEKQPKLIVWGNLIYECNTESKEATLRRGLYHDMNFLSIDKSVSLDDIEYNVTTIESEALMNCGLKTLSLPSTITSIGAAAFKDNDKLKRVLCRVIDPLVISDDVFEVWDPNTQKYVPSSATLYVDKSSIDKYSSSGSWLIFKKILPYNDFAKTKEDLEKRISGSLYGKKWSWNINSPEGYVWGNMGYCGGDGHEVAILGNSLWWGVKNEEEFMDQLQQTNDGLAHRDESMDAYMTFGTDGSIVRYAGDGSVINRGTYEVELVEDNPWKVANLHTTEGTILWPYEINSGGNMPTVFEVVYLSDEELTLVYPDGGDFDSLGNWGEATYWHFASKGEIDGTAEVFLNKSETIIEKGKTEMLIVTLLPETLTDKSVTWESSDTKVATVSSTGKVKGVKGGKATITCTSNATGAKATCEVTVGYVKLSQTELVVEKGKTATLKSAVYPSTLEDRSVTWESSDTRIATVSSAGKVKGVKGGTATITCTSKATGLKATCQVTVGYVKLSQTELVVEKGKTATLKSAVYPSTLEDRSVTWTSSDTRIATVSSAGKVKGVKGGMVTITCTSNATGLSATCQVIVGYVKLSQTELVVEKGQIVTLKAAVYPSTLEDRSVTWESSDTRVVKVSSSGKLKGVKAGTAIITCTSVSTGLSASCQVTVTAPSGSRSLDGDDDDVTGIENLDKAIEPFDVYDLRGQKVRHQVTSLDGLPDGIYIVNGKKVLKK